MRKMYRALVIMAALAIVAGALAPLLAQGLWNVVVVRIWGIGNGAESMSVIGRALSLTFGALVTGAMVFAVVLAAQTRRKGWLAVLVIAGALALYAPIVMYYYATFVYPYSNKFANISTFWYPYNEFAGILFIEAAASVIAATLALVFALTGMRQAQQASVLAEGA